jgi:hypothetical protein
MLEVLPYSTWYSHASPLTLAHKRYSFRLKIIVVVDFHAILETWVQRCRTWLDKLASVCCG